MEHIVAGISDSLGGGNTVAAPGAGSSFVSIAAPPAGVYKATAYWSLTGTAETALANAQFRANGATILGSLPTLTAAEVWSVTIERLTLDGVNPVQLRAAAAAIAGSQYSGVLVLTRIE